MKNKILKDIEEGIARCGKLAEVHASLLRRLGDASDVESICSLNGLLDLFEDEGSEEQLFDKALHFRKKATGRYYTPFALVDFLCARSLKSYADADAETLRALRLLDPCCGSGIFLLCYAQRLSNMLFDAYGGEKTREICRKIVVSECIFGIDIDRRAAEIATGSLAFFAALSRSEIHIAVADAIASPLLSDLPTEKQDAHDLALWHAAGIVCGGKLKSFPSEVELSERLSALGDNIDNYSDIKAFDRIFGIGENAFDLVVTNPPWTKLVASKRAFFDSIDADIPKRTNASEREAHYELLLGDPAVRQAYASHVRKTEIKALLSAHCNDIASDKKSHPDAYQFFVIRALRLLKEGGTLAMILPFSLCSNAGVQGIRQMIFRQYDVKALHIFDNREKYFSDIASGMRFMNLLLRKQAPSDDRFEYSSSSDGDISRRGHRRISLPAVCSDETMLLIADADEALAALIEKSNHLPKLNRFLSECGIHFTQEINMTLRARALVRFDGTGDPRLNPREIRSRGFCILHEKGTFERYNAALKSAPRYLVRMDALKDSLNDNGYRQTEERSRHYRLALRSTIHAQEKTKLSMALLPPGSLVGNSALVESNPGGRNIEDALFLLGLCGTRIENAFTAAFINTNLKIFLLERLPFPHFGSQERRDIAMTALSLCAPASLYEALFEQFSVSPASAPSEREKSEEKIERLVDQAMKRTLPKQS